MANLYDLKNKTVLITGANGQLGQEFVKVLLKQGAFVYITDRHKVIDKKLANELTKQNLKKYKYLELDVTAEKSIERTNKLINGRLDVLINNAGVGVFTAFEQRTGAELDQVIDVNLKGTILCSKIFSRSMIKAKAGKIINIGSIYGVISSDKRIYGDSGRNNSEIYSATKAGVIQFSKYLAVYLAEHNIQINAISPGGIFNGQKEFFVKNYIARTPAGRMAKVEDFSGLICFLSSEESNYITGQNIIVDGGFSAW
jgi:3-oxoacyl-[acyl-carrier protein] reductase